MSKKLPVVTIIGRRNVGKSTLFNLLLKKKKAIVGDISGLTRDVLTCRVDIDDYSFILSDTPGLDLPKDAELSGTIIENANQHLTKSDLIILLFENPQLEKFDNDLLQMSRKTGIKSIIAVNKIDNNEDMDNLANFYELGIGEIIPISSLYNKNIDLLIDKIKDSIPRKNPTEEESLKIAIVGKPNSGKSTLLNSLIGYERAVVSDVPGTTRDAINERISFNNRTVEIIDTAGIRKKSRVKEDIEYYSVNRALKSIKECDVVIHLIDIKGGITETDKKIADSILDENKPMLIAVNKWDTVEKTDNTLEEYKKYLINKFYRAMDFPIIAISAKEKIRIHKLLVSTIELAEKSKKRIETSALNKMLEMIQKNPRIPGLGTDMKIYYATQLHTTPPRFKFFVNNEDKFRPETIRFFQKELQKKMDLKGIPINIELIGKKKNKK